MPYNWYITPEHYQAAEIHGISKKILNSRVRSGGWDIKRASTEPLHGQLLKNFMTNEIKESITINNINLGTLRARITRGWTITAATTTPIRFKKNTLKGSK